MNLKHRDFALDIKAVKDDGVFHGYGSVFDEVDAYREVVDHGAFTQSLADWREKDRWPAMLWQHDAHAPIGVYTAMREDEHGLYVEGQMLTHDVPKAREAHALTKAGAISGLSIGFMVRDDSYDETENVVHLKQIDLWEVSLVTFPANEHARIDAVKAALVAGELPTLREFERYLREVGFSRSQATAIASRGLKHLRRSESESGDESEAVTAALNTLTQSARGLRLPPL